MKYGVYYWMSGYFEDTPTIVIQKQGRGLFAYTMRQIHEYDYVFNELENYSMENTTLLSVGDSKHCRSYIYIGEFDDLEGFINTIEKFDVAQELTK